MNLKLAAGCALLLALLLPLVSCGGASSSQPNTGRGAISFTVRWPDRSRLIPSAANSLRFVATVLDPDDGVVAADEFLARPSVDVTSTLLLADLPSTKMRIRVTAHASADGTGTALAAGSVEVEVPEDRTAATSVTLSSRVTEVRVAPVASTLAIGEATRFTASAFDSEGSLVVVRSDEWAWNTGNAAVAAVAALSSPDGDKADVSALGAGTATITVTERQSGVAGTATVTVSPSGSISISPHETEVRQRASVLFHAETDDGDEDRLVTWTATGGTIDAAGVYTAGNVIGDFTVTVTTVGDSLTDTVVIHVIDRRGFAGRFEGRRSIENELFAFATRVVVTQSSTSSLLVEFQGLPPFRGRVAADGSLVAVKILDLGPPEVVDSNVGLTGMLGGDDDTLTGRIDFDLAHPSIHISDYIVTRSVF